MQILYSMDLTGRWEIDQEALSLVGRRWASSLPYARRILRGVLEHREAIDDTIQSRAQNWSLSRMNVVDRNILRMATYELIFCEDIPVKVSIHEALEIAKGYGTPESARFLNGVLDRIAMEDARRAKTEQGRIG